MANNELFAKTIYIVTARWHDYYSGSPELVNQIIGVFDDYSEAQKYGVKWINDNAKYDQKGNLIFAHRVTYEIEEAEYFRSK